jgi:hypothetical protein
MRYMVYWKKMLTKDQGDAPMRDFDTTIEAHAYIRGCVDIIVTFDDNLKTENQKERAQSSLLQEFKIEKIEKGSI